jgi:hypothetical protein
MTMKPFSTSASAMALFALLLLLLLLSSYSCAAQDNTSCSVCGNGMKVGGDRNAIVTLTGQAGGQSQISCSTLEDMGNEGIIPPAQCEVLPQLISAICECESDTTTTTTEATTPAVTTKATQSGGKSSKYSKASKSKPSKTAKSSSSGFISMMITNTNSELGRTTAPISDIINASSTSTSSDFSNSDLITLLNWIVASLPVEERAEQVQVNSLGERAKQVDSLDSQSQSIQDVGISGGEANELLKVILFELIELNANFKSMRK